VFSDGVVANCTYEHDAAALRFSSAVGTSKLSFAGNGRTFGFSRILAGLGAFLDFASHDQHYWSEYNHRHQSGSWYFVHIMVLVV